MDPGLGVQRFSSDTDDISEQSFEKGEVFS